MKPDSAGSENSPLPLVGEGREVRALNHAKTMRSQPTDAEQRLWLHLRDRRFMGLKFKRQKPIGSYIADFVCLELGLIIEADGGQHGSEYDQRRDVSLKEQGFTVLHIWNHDILQCTEAVLERIREVATTLTPTPLPPAGYRMHTSAPSPRLRGEGRGEGELD